MRSSSPSVSPSARCRGCSPTCVRRPSYPRSGTEPNPLQRAATRRRTGQVTVSYLASVGRGAMGSLGCCDPFVRVSDRPARCDLGRLVPLHQGRGRRFRPDRDDGDPARGGGARPRRGARRAGRCARRDSRPAGGGVARARHRGRQRRDPVHADRLGRAVHRLRSRGDRERDDADLHRHARAADAAERARDRDPARRVRARPGRGRRARGRAAGRNLVVRRRHARRRRLGSASNHALATASMTGGALVLLPLAILSAPTDAPSAKSVASLAALTLLGTALAQLILYRAIRLHGASRTSLVTYLMPPTALFYGWLLLDEHISAATAAGLALILGGVALGSGAVRVPRRAEAVTEP